MAFAENALFKSSGNSCQSSLHVSSSLLASSRWTNEAVMASFQHEECEIAESLKQSMLSASGFSYISSVAVTLKYLQ